jgi:hypothetical protein
MHIELQPDKRYYSIGEIAKAFDVNASRFGTVNLTFLSQRKTKETGCLLLKISKFATYLSSGKRGIHIRRSKIHLKEGQRHWINLKLSGS